jgi:hypothetical protein
VTLRLQGKSSPFWAALSLDLAWHIREYLLARDLFDKVKKPARSRKPACAHLIASGITPSVAGFAEGQLCAGALPHSATLGLTSFRQLGYSGPRALSGHGPHRYVFQIFALNGQSGLKPRATRRLLVAALARKVVGRGRLEGIFESL